MSDYPITLTIPSHIYDRARQAAEATDQPIERVLLQQLEDALSPPLPELAPDEQAELDALVHLSDDALWTIAREQMPEDRQIRLQSLMDRNSIGALTESEQEELNQLVEQSQRLMVRKAGAAALLTRRGHPVTPQTLSPEHE